MNGQYLVNDIYTAVQGEGVQTGVPMVLLRLHGCAIGCPWCDTKETWLVDEAHAVATLDEALGANPRYTIATAAQILAHIQQEHQGPKWILVTGGEPADQELKPLVTLLHEGGYQVALETSGTAAGHLGAGFDWVCVSPKIDMPGGKPILPEAVAVADEIKHVVGRERDIAALDALLAVVPLKETTQICLQPVSLSQRATDLCIATVLERGWRLSVQVHKYIGQR